VNKKVYWSVLWGVLSVYVGDGIFVVVDGSVFEESLTKKVVFFFEGWGKECLFVFVANADEVVFVKLFRNVEWVVIVLLLEFEVVVVFWVCLLFVSEGVFEFVQKWVGLV